MKELPVSNQVFITKLIDIIHANLENENFGVKELAQGSGIGLKNLRKRLKAGNRKSVNQFIREVRLQKALEILQKEEVPVSEVAFRVGFSSPIYFIKCFHELFGFSPGKVRNEDLTERDFNRLTRNLYGQKRVNTFWKRYAFTLPGILIFAIFLGAIGFVLFKKSNKPERLEDLVSSDGRISIAIMPFQNLTNDTIWNIWQDGIQNELISYLSDYKELKLKQSELISSMLNGQDLYNFALLTPNIAARASKKIDASTFLYGRILESGLNMRVTAQLVDTKSKEVFKSFQIERPSREEFVFQVIDSLSIQIKNFLIITILGKEVGPEGRPASRSPEAYRYYIKGLKAFLRYDYSEAVYFYEQALARDSDFTIAASDISFAYAYLGQEDQTRKWCLWLYKRKDRMSYLNKIWVEYVYAHNFETPYESIKYLERLQAYDDQGSNYHFLIGNEYLISDQIDQAVDEFRKSLEMFKKRGPENLVDWDYAGLGLAYHYAGRYKEEKKLYKEASKRFPEGQGLLYRQAVLSLTEKDTSSAGKYIDKYKFILKNNAFSQADILTKLALIYSEAQMHDKAEVYYRQALSLEPDNPVRINNLSYFLIDNERNLSEGVMLADSGLIIKPDDYNLLATKGWGLYKLGDFQQSLLILQKSWDLRRQYSIYDHTAFLHLEQVKKMNTTSN